MQSVEGQCSGPQSRPGRPAHTAIVVCTRVRIAYPESPLPSCRFPPSLSGSRPSIGPRAWSSANQSLQLLFRSCEALLVVTIHDEHYSIGIGGVLPPECTNAFLIFPAAGPDPASLSKPGYLPYTRTRIAERNPSPTGYDSVAIR